MRKKMIILLLIAVLAALVWISDVHEYLSFEHLKEQRETLRNIVDDHYLMSASVFIAIFISTAFFVPGALVSTIAAGFLFGVFPGTVYVTVGSVVGASLAFLSARFLLGDRIQEKYHMQLRYFNTEMEKHGHNYLFVLRIVPILPFFLVNYLAGLTTISLKRFVLTTSVGMLPGTLAYTFAGRQLAELEHAEDVFSFRLLIAFLLLAAFALAPVLKSLIDRRRSRT